MVKFWSMIICIEVLNIALSACCPHECRCDERRNTVFCNERKLRQIPYDIPSDTRILWLQGNALENNPRLESVLESLASLEKLDLHDNKLISFPKNLPASLRYLSLRLNVIKFVGKNALRGLSNLKELHMDYNNITGMGLRPGAFSAATSLEDLALTNNAFTTLPENLPFNLKSLRVANNKISFVSSRSLETLQSLYLLDLSNNVLEEDLEGLEHLSKLKVLDLTNNRLTKFPSNLPTNLTELRLSSNQIQYIYANHENDNGDFYNINKLEKLDISFNRLRSIERGSFNSLPASLSMELQGNPWGCDCNLVYFKQWLTFTNIILASRAEIKCATPPALNNVALDEVDSKALKCSHFSHVVKIKEVTATAVTIELNTDDLHEPPFVTYSIMYGAMLCKDCTLKDDGNPVPSASESNARMWIGEYTVKPIVADVSTKMSNLKPDTKYAICVITSYQHPNHIGIEQCEDVQTFSINTDGPTPIKVNETFPWIEILGAGGAVFLLAILICTAVICWRRRSLQFFGSKRHSAIASTTGYSARRGRPLVTANPEFDVTLMIRQDLQHKSDSCCSDSHDESVATTHTGTMTSRNSDHILKYNEDSTATYLTPISFSGIDSNTCVSSPHDSGLCL